jgi:hypothetical protein
VQRRKYWKDKKVLYIYKSVKDDKGYTLKKKVNFDKFTLEVIVPAKQEVVLNNNESVVYRSSDLKKMGVF